MAPRRRVKDTSAANTSSRPHAVICSADDDRIPRHRHRTAKTAGGTERAVQRGDKGTRRRIKDISLPLASAPVSSSGAPTTIVFPDTDTEKPKRSRSAGEGYPG